MEFEFEITEADGAGTHLKFIFIDSRSQKHKISFLEFQPFFPFLLSPLNNLSSQLSVRGNIFNVIWMIEWEEKSQKIQCQNNFVIYEILFMSRNQFVCESIVEETFWSTRTWRFLFFYKKRWCSHRIRSGAKKLIKYLIKKTLFGDTKVTSKIRIYNFSRVHVKKPSWKWETS
jgi:hypothetical protein